MFDVPNPFELNRRAKIKQDFQQRKQHVLAAKSGKNRYSGMMSPIIMPANHISELRKGSEQIKDNSNDSIEETPKSKKSLAESKKSQMADLARSPALQRRATLKLALAEAANLHHKMTAFAQDLAKNKDKSSDSSDESTPCSSKRNKKPTGLIKLHPMSGFNNEMQEKKKPNIQPRNFRKIAKVKAALYGLDELTFEKMLRRSETIKEAENEVSPSQSLRKGSNVLLKKNHRKLMMKKGSNVQYLTNLGKYNYNIALENYMSQKLVQNTMFSATTVPTLNVSNANLSPMSHTKTLSCTLLNSKFNRSPNKKYTNTHIISVYEKSLTKTLPKIQQFTTRTDLKSRPSTIYVTPKTCLGKNRLLSKSSSTLINSLYRKSPH